jgi:hypothetical protein
MFNPKGFCPAHSAKIEKVEIPQNLRDKFVKEATFLLYVMLWLEERNETFKFYGNFVKYQNQNIM